MKRIKNKKDYLLLGLAGAGFIVGIILMNMEKKVLLESTGLLSEYTLYEMKYSTIDSNAFFFYVLQKRVGLALLLGLLSTTWIGMAIFYAGGVWLGISFSMLVAAATIRYGIKGILLIMVGIFPQAIIYFPVAFLFLKWSREFCTLLYHTKGQSLKPKVLQYVVLLLLVIAGCLLEGYVNPILVINLLKIF